jgi:hypothetical protein
VPTGFASAIAWHPATIYHALGYDEASTVIDQLGRPHHFVKGRPVTALF